MDKKKLKETALLNKSLVHLLTIFEKNKEWADLGNWIQKIENLLKEHRSPYITEKYLFAKRLAQCLNPLLPHGIHLQTLQVYEIIFQNMKIDNVEGQNAEYVKLFCEDLALYSVGLFPFFQCASSQVKPKLLEIFQNYYIPIEMNLIPCLPGLVQSILCGLDEQNEELQKSVIQTLDLASLAVGRKYLLGSIWMAILRSSRSKSGGIKYLSKRLPKMQTDDDEYEEQDDMDHEHAIMPSLKIQQKSCKSEDIEPGSIEDMEKIDIKQFDFKDYVNQKSIDKENTVSEQTNDPNEQNDQLQPEQKSQQAKPEIQIYEDQQMLKRLKQIKLLAFNSDQDNDETNYPNKSSLILNCLLSCLEEENILVQRLALDFMFQHLKIQHPLFNEQEKKILIEGVLNLLIKKDPSLSRRVNTWLFGRPNLENKYVINSQNKMVIPLIIDAFTNIFQRVPTDSFTGTLPIKIIQIFYMEHDHLSNIKFFSFSF